MNSSQPQLNSLPERDLELLSAYLDNQLTVAERVGFERRLGAEPRLRAELEELRSTAALLRDLQPARPPRSFTIDPASPPRRAFVFPIAWAMQLGGGLAGLALVLLASVQILAGMPAGAPVAMPASSAMEASSPTEGVVAMALPTEAAASAAVEPPAAAMPAAEPTAAPMADAPHATAAPMATVAPAAQAPAAREDAGDQAAGAEQSAGSSPPNLPYGSGSAGGGAAGMGGGPEIDQYLPPFSQSESSSPGTEELPAGAATVDEGQPAGLPPGLTLAIGALLIALAAGSYLYGRYGRRA